MEGKIEHVLKYDSEGANAAVAVAALAGVTLKLQPKKEFPTEITLTSSG